MRARKFTVVPPFRSLDPGLATAELLLDAPDVPLRDVVAALPDEMKAAELLNRTLSTAGATPQLVRSGSSWRVMHRSAAPEQASGELADAAAAIAHLVAIAGWDRLKVCADCGVAFCDRTSGNNRLRCATHASHH